MKTIIYNTETNTILYTFENGYYTSTGEPGIVNFPLVYLEYIDAELVYDPATQVATKGYDIEIYPEPVDGLDGKCTEIWNIRDKTAVELARETWHHSTPHRIIIPSVLLYAPAPEGLPSFSVIGLHLMIRNLPMVEQDDLIYVYCNEIDPAHQQIVNALQGVITIENYPNE